MKKLLSLLLVLALAFSLVGCGKDKPADTAETKKDTAQETKDDYKVKGYIDVTEENEKDIFSNIEYLSEERLDEIGDYFGINKEETLGMTYEQVEKVIGLPGLHFVEDDEVRDGIHVKDIFWYSEEKAFFAIFIASDDKPDDFLLSSTGVYQEGDSQGE